MFFKLIDHRIQINTTLALFKIVLTSEGNVAQAIGEILTNSSIIVWLTPSACIFS